MNSKNSFSNRLDSTSDSGNMRRNDVKNALNANIPITVHYIDAQFVVVSTKSNSANSV